jgi:hypothetical protein
MLTPAVDDELRALCRRVRSVEPEAETRGMCCTVQVNHSELTRLALAPDTNASQGGKRADKSSVFQRKDHTAIKSTTTGAPCVHDAQSKGFTTITATCALHP